MPIALNKTQAIVAIIIVVVVLVFVLGFLGIIPGIRRSEEGDPNFPKGEVNIDMWVVGDQQNAYSSIFDVYKNQHRGVRIEYRRFDDWEEYEKELLNALAENRGPDLFMVHSSWIDKHGGKMIPAPESMISTNGVQNGFPEVVSNDFIRSGRVWAMPLYMDALALLYNKDIFNANAVVFPPTDWMEFVDTVVELRRYENSKTITQAGTALGTAYNVGNVTDIITTLMLQSGSTINDLNGGVRFDEPALDSFNFFLQFSNPINPYYTWNENKPNAQSEFAAGKVGMLIEYRETLKKLEEQNPFLNIGVAPLPQINQYSSSAVTADYVGLAVARQAGAAKGYVSWDLIRTITTNAALNATYLEETNRLPALRAEIQKLLNTEDDVFARAFFIADSWQRADWEAIEEIMQEAIIDVRSGRIDSRQALKAAEAEINELY